mgnify:CR=1 FL=1
MEAQFTDAHKKMLEKVYAKLFENNKITEEGRNLCAEADVRPGDLQIKTFEKFKSQVPGCHSEVAQIRFYHYQNKRLSKLYLYLVMNSTKF